MMLCKTKLLNILWNFQQFQLAVKPNCLFFSIMSIILYGCRAGELTFTGCWHTVLCMCGSILRSKEPREFCGACSQAEVAHTGACIHVPLVFACSSTLLLFPYSECVCGSRMGRLHSLGRDWECFVLWRIPFEKDAFKPCQFYTILILLRHFESSSLPFLTLFTELLICFPAFKGPSLSLSEHYPACQSAIKLLSVKYKAKCAHSWCTRKQKQNTEAHLGIDCCAFCQRFIVSF